MPHQKYVLCVVLAACILLGADVANARSDLSEVCDELERADDDQVTLSVKYQSTDARDASWSIMNPVMHLDFISRVIGDMPSGKALSLCRRDDVVHMELIARTSKDATLHRLLEIYRVYTYVLGGRFSVSAFNFSQGVRTDALGKGTSGEHTIAEALDAVAHRAAPVFVAAGNSPEWGLNPYAEGDLVFPVVATESGGRAIFSRSSRPSATANTKRLFLFADGAPRPKTGTADAVDDPRCNTGKHLSLGQLLSPEESGIDPGGSSFATFAATASACYVHQYLNVLENFLSAEKAVGTVAVQPFVAYFVDNPIDAQCPALKYRLADKRKKYEASYQLGIHQKQRIQDFFFGETVEFNPRYSSAVLHAFYTNLPSLNAEDGAAAGRQRYVGAKSVISALRKMTFGDLVRTFANKRSKYYPRWLQMSANDTEPVLDGSTIDGIVEYCQNYGQFIVLSDKANAPY